jgi:hypothetical protein
MESGYKGIIIFGILFGFVVLIIILQKYGGKSRDTKNHGQDT